MLQKTRGIVLHSLKYSDSSSIVKIYTENFGLQSYIVSGIRSKKSSVKANLLQPLSLIDMVVYHKAKKQLQRIKEIKMDLAYTSIPHDMVKRAIALFVNEVLYKSIQEEEANPNLFGFLRGALEILDLKMEHFINFHLLFLVQLSKYMGFAPQGNFSLSQPYFNLIEGHFQASPPLHTHYMDETLSKNLSLFLNSNFESLEFIHLGNEQRKALLKKLIEYYGLHLNGLRAFKSHLILEEISS